MSAVLIVEQQNEDVLPLAQILEKTFDVLTARSIPDAEAILTRDAGRISAVIIDACFPADGAYRLLSAIAENESCAMPVLISIEQDDSEKAQKAFELGAMDCITRPYNPAVVLRRLSNAMLLEQAKTDIDGLRAESQLKTSLVSNSMSAVFVVDAQTYELLYVNEACAKMCGKTMQEAKTQPCYMYMRGRSNPCSSCVMDTAQYDRYTEREFLSPNSDKQYVLRGKLLDWCGRRALVEYCSDESERITTRERLQDLVNRIPAGFGVFRIYPDDTIKLTYMNDGYYSIIRAERERRKRYFEDSFVNAIHPEDVEVAMSSMLEAAHKNKATCADIRIRAGNGEYRWMSARCRAAYSSDDLTILYLAISDIDRIKKIQLELEANQRMISLVNSEGKVSLWTYDIATKAVTRDLIEHRNTDKIAFTTNVPESMVESGLVFPKDETKFLNVYKRIAAGAKRSECLVRIKNTRRDTYEWQRIVLSRLSDQYYGRNTILGMSIDVTAQQEARLHFEKELLLRKELLGNALLYYEYNISTDYVEEYHSTLDEKTMFERKVKVTDAVMADILSRIVEEDRDLVRQTLFKNALKTAFSAGKKSTECIYRRIMPDGSLHYVQSVSSIMERPNTGEIIAFIYVKDIDRHIKDDQAIDSIIDEAVESACIIDAGSGMAHLLRTHDKLLGYPKGKDYDFEVFAEKLGNNYVYFEDIVAFRDFFPLQNLKETLEHNEVAILNFRVTEPDGQLKRKRTVAFYVDEKRTCIVVARRDVTTMYEEEQRQKAELQSALRKAEEASHAKSDFLSSMSHDMRTPLNAVIGLTELAKYEKNPPQTVEYLNTINDSSHYLLQLINDILDVSRIERGKLELFEESFPLEEFKRSINTIIKPLADKKNIEFVFDMGCGADNIHVDKTRFCQIFINLLSNAIKFTEPGGRVEFVAEHIPNDSSGRHGMRFYVRDNGCGMSKEFMAQLFQPFAQENSNSVSLGGAGLGLAIVKQLVDAFGGRISVKSEPGKGTEFAVDLYAYFDTVSPQKSIAYSDDFTPLSGKRILVVEDNEVNALVVMRLLDKKDCIVEVAENGQIAVNRFRDTDAGYYDAILMDMRMPVMDGKEAVRLIRALDKADAKTVPIIALTANAFSDERENFSQIGMNAYLTKPIEPKEMFNTIMLLTESRREHLSDA